MVLAGAVSVAALGFAAWAQDDGDESSCSTGCYEAEDQCYESCGEAEDPGVCEKGCADRAEACLEACD
jgi:hypothetical protein